MTVNISVEERLFQDWFETITGFQRLNWQRRLFIQFINNDMPSSLDLPTGLGKTTIMAIWLLARAFNPSLPRRLVYVVDRRVVVDQATKVAEDIRDALDNKHLAELRCRLGLSDVKLPVSTLRGKFADNREWLADPTIPAIIVGTIDMVGSRLLFEGYGVSRTMRRYHAGFLGADSLCVLDETHLCQPFDALLYEIANTPSLHPALDSNKIIRPFKCLSLSATGKQKDDRSFALEPEDFADEIVVKRLNATKELSIETLVEGNLSERLADLAWQMKGTNNRLLIYCNRREDTQKIKQALDKLMKLDKVTYPINLLVGARRVRERQNLVAWLNEHGFLAGSGQRHGTPVFLIATSAGEVGIDLDADHMVCDLVAFERMVQRFGRVNRRGENQAEIKIVAFLSKKIKPDSPFEDVFEARKRILEELGGDASPGAIVALKAKTKNNEHLETLLQHAISSEPLRPQLTRATVDAWSMTSLENHTGRPQIEPWLRGWIDKEEPDTTIAWRQYLAWRSDETQPNRNEVDAFFDNAPIHLSESLEVPTSEAVKTLTERAKNLLKNQSVDAECNEFKKSAALLIFNRSGKLQRALAIGDLLAIDIKDLRAILSNRQVVVSRALGGLNKDGLLDSSADEAELVTLDCCWSAQDLKDIVGYRVGCFMGADNLENDWRDIHSFRLNSGEDEDNPQMLTVQVFRGANAQRQGDPAIARFEQSLEEHHQWAGKEMAAIAEVLGIPAEYANMLIVAILGHDLGKQRERWQNAMNAPRAGRPFAKTKGGGNTRMLSGYRHEFGSLADVASDPVLNQLPETLKDLALHCIVSHHGYACPVIPAIDPDAPPSILAERAQAAALRFARLQRQWGPWGLAWWEAVFRAADHRASQKRDQQPQTETKQ